MSVEAEGAKGVAKWVWENNKSVRSYANSEKEVEDQIHQSAQEIGTSLALRSGGWVIIPIRGENGHLYGYRAFADIWLFQPEGIGDEVF